MRRSRSRRTAREERVLNDPREMGSSWEKTEAQPERHMPPVHAARRFDGGHVVEVRRQVNLYSSRDRSEADTIHAIDTRQAAADMVPR